MKSNQTIILASLLAMLLVITTTVTASSANQCPICSQSEPAKPVCGRNSKGKLQTFNTKCLLDEQNCAFKQDFTMIKEGRC